MADLIALDDARDERLRDYTDLRDVQLRQSMEHERGIYIAEGTKVIERAVAAGHVPKSLLLAPRWLGTLSDILDSTDAPAYVLDEKAIERVTGFHVHRGALAAMHRPPARRVEDVLATARRVLVAEDLVDHTNIGAIMRNVAALGFDAVLLSPRCADPLYRRSIKVAMGAVFSLPWARIDDWYGAPDAPARARLHDLRDDAGRRRGADRRDRAGASGSAADRRLGGARPERALAARVGPPRHHPDGGGHRLAQRGRVDRDRLLAVPTVTRRRP